MRVPREKYTHRLGNEFEFTGYDLRIRIKRRHRNRALLDVCVRVCFPGRFLVTSSIRYFSGGEEE